MSEDDYNFFINVRLQWNLLQGLWDKVFEGSIRKIFVFYTWSFYIRPVPDNEYIWGGGGVKNFNFYINKIK